MGWTAALVIALAGCGRLDFASVASDPDAGAIDDGAVAHCAVWTAFGAPVDLNLHGASAHWLGGLSHDELTIYFADWTMTTSDDLWTASRASPTDTFAADTKISELDTTASEWAPQTRDGLQLVYSTDKTGNYDLMIASRATTAATFGTATPISELDTSANEYEGGLSVDKLRIYYSSSATTAGAIYMAARPDPAQPFSAPVVLGELDSPAEDANPTLTDDELEIFFQTKRNGTRYDIYTARRASRDVPFDPPVAVAELNTPIDDLQPSVSADGSRLYFNYNTQTEGGVPSDIWLATRTCVSP